jgi:predicted DNA-binding protein
MNKYTTIQIKKETHELLQEYCKERGYTLSGLVEQLIKQKINQTPKPTNILRVNT